MYKYGGSSIRRFWAVVLDYLAVSLIGVAYFFRLFSIKCYRYLHGRSKFHLSKGCKIVIDRVKISIESPRVLRYSFYCDNVQYYLYDIFSKDADSTQRYIDFKNGRVDFDIELSHYIHIRTNRGLWVI